MTNPTADRSLPSLTVSSMAPARELLDEGRALAASVRVGTTPFLTRHAVASEAEYKRSQAARGQTMQHAHIGFRRIDRTVDALAELTDRAEGAAIFIDRFGITLDWAMGYPTSHRKDAMLGTGIVLNGPEDFARLTQATTAATHFGDFMVGLPGALENTIAALQAGATAIGNLGQYFTFRLPGWDDDVMTTEMTVKALGLIAAQDADILVHSNLDDGFAGLFEDMASAIGMVLIERVIVEEMIGAKLAFCYGHHFSSPLSRMAFQEALSRITETPGSMIYGNTVSYRAASAANYASLSSYLLADIAALRRHPTGHAINPVPVTENLRIPDVDEIMDAQLFAARLAEHAADYGPVMARQPVSDMADRLIEGGTAFKFRALQGLANLGVDISDAAALMLAIRRLGAKRMEAMFGINTAEVDGEKPTIVPADWVRELKHMADEWLRDAQVEQGAFRGLRIALGTTDVHEHGAYLVRDILERLGVKVIDAGVSIDADDLVTTAIDEQADMIAVSTYNGVGVSYARALRNELRAQDVDLPVVMGGKLNAIPQHSNTDLPVDATDAIAETGVIPCATLNALVPVLRACAAEKRSRELAVTS